MFVIFSQEETNRTSELMFWSNEFGWTLLSDATVFNNKEAENIDLPVGATDIIYLPKGLRRVSR